LPRRLRALAAGAALLLAASAPAPAQDNGMQVVERLGDWLVGCYPATAEQPTRCEIVQQMSMRDTGQTVFRLAFRLTEGDAVEATILAPFGVLLKPGVTLSVDDGQPFVGDFLTCLASGCLVRFVVPPDILQALAEGTTLAAAMEVYQGQTFRVQFALAGFGDGVERLRRQAQP